MRCPVLTSRMVVPANAKHLNGRSGEVVEREGMRLRTCYALSDTDVAYDALGLRTCYAMSGPDMAYLLWARYAMSSTEIA
eukprot:1910985-Rhodomonas_salina.1